ncbi:UNKNOWN [Stylonychia lemnae]|uniref:J domain-containing protein n=1 Tax=Stylonychia lemnae TaxID=5949 RepID=A0A078BBM7_STYLE|nr:UNKNOWN [Stylonychia lemnae]|eukprot:CDW90973.1 UNKNOWN [Stylonychia lemnae]
MQFQTDKSLEEQVKVYSFDDFNSLIPNENKVIDFKIGIQNKTLNFFWKNNCEEAILQDPIFQCQNQELHTQEQQHQKIEKSIHFENLDPQKCAEIFRDTIYHETEKVIATNLQEGFAEQIGQEAYLESFAKSTSLVAQSAISVSGLGQNFAQLSLEGGLSSIMQLSDYENTVTTLGAIKVSTDISAGGTNAVALFQCQISSNSIWTVAVLAFAVEVGSHLRQYQRGEISGKMLGKKIAVSAVSGAISVGISSLGMALGASVGTCLCPGIGTLVGGIIGAGIGGIASIYTYKGIKLLADKICDTSKDVTIMQKKKLYAISLQTLNATEKTSLGTIKNEWKLLRAQYHPDKNRGNEECAQEKFKQVNIALECIETYRKEQNL